MKEIIKFFFEQIKTNTAFVAIFTSIFTLIFTQIFNIFSIKINAQMEIKKLLIKKSIDAHEDLIKFLNNTSKIVINQSNPNSRYPHCMDSKEIFIEFHMQLISFKINYSHLYNKNLMNKLYELIDYSNTIIHCFNIKADFDDLLLQNWGVELRGEILGKFSELQQIAELFLQQEILSLKITRKITAPRPYVINQTPGIQGTKLQLLYTELLQKEINI